MPITHHADDTTLMSFAAGTLGEALSAVVATHVNMCPQCRRELATMRVMGSVLVADLPAAALTKPAPAIPAPTLTVTDEGDLVLDAIERAGDVPQPLSRIVGSDISSIQWKRLGLGVWHRPLALSPAASGDLRLIKVAPGQAMPEHGHGGSELTLILAGSYTDTIGTFAVGDLADLDDAVEHKPIADAKAGCICLIASQEKARFKGVLARIAQPFVGL